MFDLIVADILRIWRSPAGVILVNYADNFLILAPTEAAVREAIMTLGNAVRQCSDDCLRFSTVDYSRASEGFEFLGYTFRVLGSDIHVGVRASTWKRLRLSLRSRMRTGLFRREHQARRSMSQLVEGFLNAQAMAEGVRDEVERLYQSVRDDLLVDANCFLDEKHAAQISNLVKRCPSNVAQLHLGARSSERMRRSRKSGQGQSHRQRIARRLGPMPDGTVFAAREDVEEGTTLA